MKSRVFPPPEATVASSFKAERVQLAPERKAGPAALVGWKATGRRGTMFRTYELASDSRACALAGAISSLFGEHRRGSISVTRSWLTVRVEAPVGGAIAQEEIQLARRVDRLIGEFRKGWESR